MTKGKTRLILLIAIVVLALGGLGLAINAGGSDQLDLPPVQASAAKPDLSSPPSATDAPSNVASPESSPVPEAAAETTLDPDVAEVPLPHEAVAVAPAPQEAQEVVEIEPDPDYEDALRNAGISTRGWLTDFSRHAVPYDTIISGGPPRDGIPPLDAPTFTTPSEAQQWLGANEPVIAFELNGDARAYPLQILTWHEIVNDVVGDEPVTITFCPLCNAALVFDRRLDGVIHDFGTSGKLRNSDLIMWDRQTESWWQQFTGKAIVGELTGKQLDILPASIISFADFTAAHPDGAVLSNDTGFSRPYGTNPYAGYDRADQPPFLFDGDLDGRLLPKERVAAISIGEVDAAFPFSILEEERVVNYTVNGKDLVVFFKFGTASALDQRSISGSRDIGATGVFEGELNGRTLTFRADGDDIVDNETGSVWNILGHAVEGELAGQRLEPIVHANHFWFSWGAFKPDTLIYRGVG
jgi:hypothetical protein